MLPIHCYSYLGKIHTPGVKASYLVNENTDFPIQSFSREQIHTPDVKPLDPIHKNTDFNPEPFTPGENSHPRRETVRPNLWKCRFINPGLFTPGKNSHPGCETFRLNSKKMQTSQSSCNEVTVNFLIYMKFYKFDLLHNFEFNPTNGLTWSKVWHKMLIDLIPWIIILLNNFDISWLLNVNTVKLIWWVIFLKVNLMSYYHEQSTNPFFFKFRKFSTSWSPHLKI